MFNCMHLVAVLFMLVASYVLNLCLCQLSKFFAIFTLPYKCDCQRCSSHAVSPVHSFTFNYYVMPFYSNKLQTLVWGCTKIPGGECHRLKIWDMELISWFVCSNQNCQIYLLGMLGGVWVSWHCSSVYVHGFPARKDKQMIVTSFSGHHKHYAYA